MSKLLITIGLPSSGKTTWAYHQKMKNPNTFVSERDQIRERLFGTRKEFTGEGKVTAEQEAEVAVALALDADVIVSDTNLNAKTQKRWRNFATKHGATFETKSFLDVPVEEVIRRDSLRTGSEMVGEAVIMDYATKYGIVKPPAAFPQIVFDPSLPLVVICDLDGTAALMGDRSPYEHGKYHLDTPNVMVREILWALAGQGYHIIYCSGRKIAAHHQTRVWLSDHDFPKSASGPLFMRADDDNRKDDLVKYEILRDTISAEYYPVLVLDDRNQVVAMWRSQGIPTFQVADGDF